MSKAVVVIVICPHEPGVTHPPSPRTKYVVLGEVGVTLKVEPVVDPIKVPPHDPV